MGHYLLDHPRVGPTKWHPTRRGSIVAIVVHITAGLEDLDAQDDHSAERTAEYARTTDRKVSWHSGSDSDSVVDLLPDDYTAFHCQGYNSRTLGHEISKAHPDWRTVPAAWATASLRNAGASCGARARRNYIPLRKATKAEVDRAIATNGPPVGFIGHWELDPGRRQDPGRVGTSDTFPWDRFFQFCQPIAAPTLPEDDMDRTCIPTNARRAGNGRLPFFRLSHDQGGTPLVLAYNGARVRRIDGDVYGIPFMRLAGLAAKPLGIEEVPGGPIVVVCEDGGTIDVAA